MTQDTPISEALVVRMVALVRRMAETGYQDPVAFNSFNGHGVAPQDSYAEARAIVAELPKPVDPDLIEAREIAEACNIDMAGTVPKGFYRSGKLDASLSVPRIYAALKQRRNQ